jgi:hypothetical protein
LTAFESEFREAQTVGALLALIGLRTALHASLPSGESMPAIIGVDGSVERLNTVTLAGRLLSSERDELTFSFAAPPIGLRQILRLKAPASANALRH